MTDARSLILERVRRAVATGRIPHADPRGRQPVRAPAADRLAWVDRFVRELGALGVAGHRAPTAADVRDRVRALIGQRRVFAWNAEALPYGLGEVLGGAVTAASSRDEQARAEVGVTGCHGAIAETGSIVVLSGRGTPRAASLLPPTHLCVVRAEDLYPSVGTFFEANAAAISAAACCTFITGPSRTADIELTLTLGVHGPGEVLVVIGP